MKCVICIFVLYCILIMFSDSVFIKIVWCIKHFGSQDVIILAYKRTNQNCTSNFQFLEILRVCCMSLFVNYVDSLLRVIYQFFFFWAPRKAITEIRSLWPKLGYKLLLTFKKKSNADTQPFQRRLIGKAIFFNGLFKNQKF